MEKRGGFRTWCRVQGLCDGWRRCLRLCFELCDNLPIRLSMAMETILTVSRRCLVCEHIDEVDEPASVDSIGVPCSSCHAPTERIAVLAKRRQAPAANPH